MFGRSIGEMRTSLAQHRKSVSSYLVFVRCFSCFVHVNVHECGIDLKPFAAVEFYLYQSFTLFDHALCNISKK